MQVSKLSKLPEEIVDEELLKIESLKVYHPVRKLFSTIGYIKAVDDVSLKVRVNEVMAIVGESGCGKTTLARAIMKLIPVTSGKMVFNGIDITKLSSHSTHRWYSRQVGFVQQDPYGAMPSFMSIKTILEEPMRIHKIPKQERAKRVIEVLEEVGLTPPEDFTGKYPHMLSGGQLQRVAIARALVLKPKMIIADEPVSMLDASVRIEILNLFRELQARYKTAVIYITHDFATAKYFSDKISVMYAGQLVELGSAKEVINNPKHPYTQALINVLPDPDPENRFKLKRTLPGEPPNLMRPPPGCRLAPRCPFVMEKCQKEDPPFFNVSNRLVKCWLYE
ncbi:MAG: ABC transporter ATP-binding protein [Desulfurococcaceae archaeon]